MGDLARQWGESEWEAYANSLLSTHFGLLKGSYQRIPAKTGGDHGLEGLSGCGEAYQCYADQGSKDGAERTKKQKKKVRDDLKKLVTYQTFWEGVLGTKRIRTWTLMVPEFSDKSLVKYAKQKGRELLTKGGLKFLDPNFEVFVKTADDFPAALRVDREPRLPKGSAGPVTPVALDAFKKKEPAFVQHIDEKLKKALPKIDPAARERYRDDLLAWHLNSSNLIDDLHTYFPTEWEDLVDLIAKKGRSIDSENLLDSSPASQRLASTRREFAESLKSAQKWLSEGDRETVSWGTVSKWLGECPLDFPGA